MIFTQQFFHLQYLFFFELLLVPGIAYCSRLNMKKQLSHMRLFL